MTINDAPKTLGLIAAAAAAILLLTVAAALWTFWPDRAAPTLSVFEPHAGGCAWYRMAVNSRDQDLLSRFPVDCQNVQVAWAPQGHGALVWFSPEAAAATEVMLFAVDLDRHRFTRLPLPDIGLAEGGYTIDRSGTIIAYTIDDQAGNGERGEGGTLVFNGQSFAPRTDTDGIDVLVHTLAWNGHGWDPVETSASRCCADGAPGIRVLKHWRDSHQDLAMMFRQSSLVLAQDAGWREETDPTITAALQVQLQSGAGDQPRRGDLPWIRLARPEWPRTLVAQGFGHGSGRAMGTLFFAERRRLTPLPGLGFSSSDVVLAAVRQQYLLLTEWATGLQPHLYDMTNGNLLYASKVAASVTFWPDPLPVAAP